MKRCWTWPVPSMPTIKTNKMTDFRHSSPCRRKTPPTCKQYREYKSILREDFHQRCGYCGDHDFFRDTFYEIDHFVPKDLDKSRIADYTNLVYSCRICNNTKRAQWPTGNITKPNDGYVGWIDPCDAQYAEQFERIADGSIMAKTRLGTWMWKSLALGNPVHRIKWKLEQLRNELSKMDDIETDNITDLKQIKELNTLYRRFEESLRGVPDFC